MRIALAAAIFVVTAIAIALSGRLDGDFRIDEAHKIGESCALRTVELGDFSPNTWLSSRVERSNPPVGKLLFGAALQLANAEVPYDPMFLERAARGERLPPPHLAAAYRRALRPARLVSLLATALTASAVFLLAEAVAGTAGGFLAAILYACSFLPLTFSATAVFDPLLVLFVVAAAVPVATAATWPRTVAAAVLAALAFDVRASGAIALIGVLVLLLARRAAGKAVAAGAIAFAAATAMNPVDWVAGSEILPLRIARRYAMQFRDLSDLLAATHEHRLTLPEKVRFVSEYAFGDVAGIALLLGCLLAIAVAVILRRSLHPLLAWCATIAVGFTLWLPVGYPRYVLMAVPPLAIAAAFGWTGIRAAVSRVRSRPA